MGCPPEHVPGLKNPEQTTEATSTTVKEQPLQCLALNDCRPLKDCVLPKTEPDAPQLTVLFDCAIEERLQPILVQCVGQAKILLEKCQNFQTLKNWIKYPVFQFPQWDEHFEITWGDENEMAIYIHHVGPDCYTLGKCVAVIRKVEASSS